MSGKSVQVNLEWLLTLPSDWRDPLTAYLEGEVQATLEESTLDVYNSLLRLWARWCIDQKIGFGQFDMRRLDAYTVYRKNICKVSDRTRRLEISYIKGFFDFCQRRKYRKHNPIKEYPLPRVSRPHVYVPSEQELKALLDSTKERYSLARNRDNMKYLNLHRRTFYSCRNYAILCMAIESSCRIGEILNLKLKDYRSDRLQISITTAKGNEARTVPIDARGKLIDAVASWINVRPRRCKTDYLFVNDEGHQTDYHALSKWVREQIRFAEIHPFTLHNIRHYSINAEGRVNLQDAQKKAGHKDIKTTELYLKDDVGYLRETHEKAAPLERLFAVEDKPKGRKRDRVF